MINRITGAFEAFIGIAVLAIIFFSFLSFAFVGIDLITEYLIELMQ